ncbi:hypothetical protein [Kaistia soli]|uniref:hypothetical protein n=1 Tax=Kaistia soli TaxID=446684 RepID=UPI00158800D7|nr:hypothetical protein [Kaistia soli]
MNARALWIDIDPDRETPVHVDHADLLEEGGSFARGLAYGLLLTAVLAALVIGLWMYVF